MCWCSCCDGCRHFFASNSIFSFVLLCTLCSSRLRGNGHGDGYVRIPYVSRTLNPIFLRNGCSAHQTAEVIDVCLVWVKRSTVPPGGSRYILVCMLLLCNRVRHDCVFLGVYSPNCSSWHPLVMQNALHVTGRLCFTLKVVPLCTL